MKSLRVRSETPLGRFEPLSDSSFFGTVRGPENVGSTSNVPTLKLWSAAGFDIAAESEEPDESAAEDVGLLNSENVGGFKEIPPVKLLARQPLEPPD